MKYGNYEQLYCISQTLLPVLLIMEIKLSLTIIAKNATGQGGDIVVSVTFNSNWSCNLRRNITNVFFYFSTPRMVCTSNPAGNVL